MSVQSKSDGVNTSLFEKREHIEKLHRTRNLLRKVQVCNESLLLAHFVCYAVLSPDHHNSSILLAIVNLLKLIFVKKEQFIYDLPARLHKCIKSEAYGDAVRFYTGAMPILKVYICPQITFPFVVGSLYCFGAFFDFF